MSLIACTINDSIPFIIGDLLISSQDDTRIPYIIPTTGVDISHLLPYNDGFIPIGMNQKIYIINKDLCVALAGKVYYMKQILRDLKDLSRVYNDKLTCDILFQFLKNYDAETTSKICVFVLLMEHLKNGEIKVWQTTHGFWGVIDTEIYGKVFASASGWKDFLLYANQKVVFTTPFPEGTINRTLISNICLIVGLLGLERTTLHTVKKLWGAGFETIYYDEDDKTFKKIDDITYIIWDAKFDEEGNINPKPSLILKYKYYGDALGITTIERNSKNYGHNFYTVHPIDYNELFDITNIPEDKSFTSHKIANAFVLETKDNIRIPITFYTHSIDFEVTFKNNQPHIFIHSDIVELIKKTAKDFFIKL